MSIVRNSHICRREILKDDRDFEGFVMSDFVLGVHDGKAARVSGLDLEMPFRQHFTRRLKRQVENGQVPEKVIDEAVLRLLRQKIRFAQVGRNGGARQPGSALPLQASFQPQHRGLARQVR